MKDFLDAYGAALAAGDLPAVAACYHYPALVVGDQGTVPVAAPSDVEAAFAGAAEQYRERGLTGIAGTVERVDELTGTLTAVDVRWSYLDDAGTERSSSRFHYVVRREGDRPGICVVAQRDG